VFRCVSKGSSTQSGATRQARPFTLRGSAHPARTEATQQSHLAMEKPKNHGKHQMINVDQCWFSGNGEMVDKGG
jgi:hypothetical protein